MPVINRPLRQQQPRNRGSVGIARSSIQQLSPVAAEQNANALAVNGYPVLYYRRKHSGLPCTCSTANPVANDEVSPDAPLDQDGNGTDAFLQTMLQGNDFAIERYGSRSKEPENKQRSEPHGPLWQADTINVSTDIDDPFAEEIDDQGREHDDDRIDINDNFLAASSNTGCGVCLGSNWVGGFDLVNGLRIVFDTQAQWFGLDNLIVLQDQHPFRFITAGNATAYIEITVPVGVAGLDCVRLWNNKQQILRNYDVSIEIENNWYVLDEKAIKHVADGMPRKLRIRTSAPEWTHLEIQFDLGMAPIYAEWPRLTESQNMMVPENYDTATVSISPLVPKVSMLDVVVDTTYSRHWLIGTVQNFVDRNRTPNGWEVTARMVQKYEYPYLLFIRRVSHNHDAQPTLRTKNVRDRAR